MIKWWVNEFYAAHEDMRGHTGGTMSMGKNGKGLIISISKKQTLNSKSLTEAVLIRADNAMKQMLWTRYFLKAKGYGIY